MRKGFSMIEIIIAVAMFAVFATGIAGVVVTGFTGGRQGEEQTKATQYAAEGLEAVRSVKNQLFSSLVATASSGVTRFSGVWSLFNINNTFEKYTRTIAIADVARDSSGNVVVSGGTNDLKTKKVTSTVSWAASGARNDSVVLSTYLSDFRKQIAKPGMLVYGNGGTTTDAISYQIINENGDWLTASAAADVDGGSSNRVLQTVRLYSSATRNEKIMVSRHYNGATQFIYGQVFNGTTWGNVQLLSSWAAVTFLDVLNFDGTYLVNGDFMVVYSDNTTTPKFRTWNGTTWSAQVSMQTTGAIPMFAVARVRDATNEVMAAFYGTNRHTDSEYFNGGSYTTGNWAAAVSHATNGATANSRLVDFAWSPNSPLLGAIIYTNGVGVNSQIIRAKLWTANGTGGGSWGAQTSSVNQGSSMTTLQIASRPGTTEWQVCDKDGNPNIVCYKLSSAVAWSSPTNNSIATTDGGRERSYDMRYEPLSGDPGLIVYSDTSTTPKYKKYNAATATYDLAASSVPMDGVVAGSIRAVNLVPAPITDDIMAVFSDSNLDVITTLWDGANGVFFTTPAGRAATLHGTSGSATINNWFDFVWDSF